MWEVAYYETATGKMPVREFLHTLPVKLRAKAYREIELLTELGAEMGMPYSRHIQDGVFELRIQMSGDTARVFYFFITGKRIILTNGFIKKTQKTPTAELEKALRYKADFERRKES